MFRSNFVAVSIPLFTLFLIFFINTGAHSQFDEFYPLLEPDNNVTYYVYPRADAMGGCAINLVDEQSGFVNPASLGFFHMNRNLSFFISDYVKNDIAEIERIDDDLKFRSLGFSGGINFHKHVRNSNKVYTYCISAGYYDNKLDFGWMLFSNFDGEDTWRVKWIDRTKSYSVSMAADVGIRIGLGYNFTKYNRAETTEDNPEYDLLKTDGHSLGLLVELPIFDIWWNQPDIASANRFKYSLTPSFAYVTSTIDEDEFFNYYLPDVKQIGFSIYFDMKTSKMILFSIRPSYLFQKPSYNLPHETLQEIEWIDKYGVEIGALGVGYFRIGKWESKEKSPGSIGFGISLTELKNFMLKNRKIHTRYGFINTITNNLNLTIDYAKAYGTNFGETGQLVLRMSI